VKGKARFDNWREEIVKAGDVRTVGEIVGRFMDSLDAVEVHALPDLCRRDQIHTPQDIANCAVTLARASFVERDTAASIFLKDVSLIFAEATTRIATLALGRDSFSISGRIRNRAET
jgi:hypothetical protein